MQVTHFSAPPCLTVAAHLSAGSNSSSGSSSGCTKKGCAAICACARKLRAINHATGSHFLPHSGGGRGKEGKRSSCFPVLGGGSSRRLSPLADCCATARGRLARSDKHMKESPCGMWQQAALAGVSAVSGIRIHIRHMIACVCN